LFASALCDSVKRGGSTLEANIANLNCKTLQGEVQADPLFRKTSAAFDEAGARGLLLNNLGVVGNCALVFDSADAKAQGAIPPLSSSFIHTTSYLFSMHAFMRCHLGRIAMGDYRGAARGVFRCLSY
jgi:hypothetical protein